MIYNGHTTVTHSFILMGNFGFPPATASSLTMNEVVEVGSDVGVYDPVDYLGLLINLHRSKFTLPMDLILDIFQFANIVPRIRSERSALSSYSDNCDAVYMSSKTILILRHFVPTSIYFEVESRDQGWSSYPEDQGKRNSCTWIEASLSETVATSIPRCLLFTNIHAGQDFEFQQVRCDAQSGLVRDMIALADNGEFPLTIRMHARSRYPGWRIRIRRAAVEIELSLRPNWKHIFLT